MRHIQASQQLYKKLDVWPSLSLQIAMLGLTRACVAYVKCVALYPRGVHHFEITEDPFRACNNYGYVPQFRMILWIKATHSPKMFSTYTQTLCCNFKFWRAKHVVRKAANLQACHVRFWNLSLPSMMVQLNASCSSRSGKAFNNVSFLLV